MPHIPKITFQEITIKDEIYASNDKQCFICLLNFFDDVVDIKLNKLAQKAFAHSIIISDKDIRPDVNQLYGYAHGNCLDIWFQNSSKCPHCLQEADKETIHTQKELKYRNIKLLFSDFVVGASLGSLSLCTGNFLSMLVGIFAGDHLSTLGKVAGCCIGGHYGLIDFTKFLATKPLYYTIPASVIVLGCTEKKYFLPSVCLGTILALHRLCERQGVYTLNRQWSHFRAFAG